MAPAAGKNHDIIPIIIEATTTHFLRRGVEVLFMRLLRYARLLSKAELCTRLMDLPATYRQTYIFFLTKTPVANTTPAWQGPWLNAPRTTHNAQPTTNGQQLSRVSSLGYRWKFKVHKHHLVFIPS
jgi:hypothetical protein